jgi:hypothetical protein
MQESAGETGEAERAVWREGALTTVSRPRRSSRASSPRPGHSEPLVREPSGAPRLRPRRRARAPDVGSR